MRTGIGGKVIAMKSTYRKSFVIWGTGVMGKVAYGFLGAQNVMGFIDQNPSLQGKSYDDKPVLSFQESIQKFPGAYIIITPKDTASIVEKLSEHHYEAYSFLADIVY